MMITHSNSKPNYYRHSIPIGKRKHYDLSVKNGQAKKTKIVNNFNSQAIG